jgi:hypothetical protein
MVTASPPPVAERNAWGRQSMASHEGPSGELFAFRETKDGRVRIAYCGKVVTTLAGREAERFLSRSSGAGSRDLQLLMAKVTGNFKRGNERAD